MTGAVYKAAAGALLMQQRLDVLSNNLANVNTVGYKADRPEFRVLLNDATSSAHDGPAQLSPYAPPFSFHVDFSSGSLLPTNNPLDVAISGNGFFEIQTDDGIQYSRKGSFSINENGVLSTSDGWPVLGEGGQITIDGSHVAINDQGEIFVDNVRMDRLRVVDFKKPYELQKMGNDQFAPLKDDVRPNGAEGYSISQGFVESSNVNAIRTMTEVIESLRVFESYQRVIRAADEANEKTVNEVGRKV